MLDGFEWVTMDLNEEKQVFRLTVIGLGDTDGDRS